MPHRENESRSLVLEVERFEHVEAGAERVLLRVDGRYSDRPGKRVLDAMLYVDDGLAVHRHAAMEDDGSDADLDGWLWRAAFDVPASYLTDERTRFALEAEPGRLIDLHRPAPLVRTSAVPLTARAAHTARRYAAAVAILLTVAVTPGGLPASARTEVLRVRHADGSVVYLTRDGQPLSSVPGDAVVIDQSAPAPTPAPAPQPQPDASPQPAPQMQEQTNLSDAARSSKDAGSSPAAPAAPKAHDGKQQHKDPRKGGHKQHGQQQSGGATGDTTISGGGTATSGSDTGKPHKRAHTHRHHQAQTDTQQQQPDPSAPSQPTSSELQSMPALLTAPGASHTRLEPLGQIGAKEHKASTADSAQNDMPLPSKSLHDMGDLAGGPAHDSTNPAPPPMQLPNGSIPPSLIPQPTGDGPSSTGGNEQEPSGSSRHASPPKAPEPRHPTTRHTSGGTKAPAPAPAPAPPGNSGGTPTTSGPTFFDTLPGPAKPGAVPDFVISRFRVPPFLLPIYQAAGIQYGIRWEVLAAINEIETDYGRNLNVSSAGALGWMQFMPSTWKMYGTDANRDGERDPYNPVDAIFAAARYLKAAGGDKDIRRAIFAYNHAGWYVDSVMLRARLIAGYPPDLIGSLTGLTEGRFPVAAQARYPDDLQANKPAGQSTPRGIDIFSHQGAPVVAVNDGVIKAIGHSKTKGYYVVLQDVYGNQFTYSGLASVSKLYPVPKTTPTGHSKSEVESVGANDPKPTAAASAGAQPLGPAPAPTRRERRVKPRNTRKTVASNAVPARAVSAVKRRLFAHPARPQAQKHGGFDQLMAMRSGKAFETYDNYFSRALGLNSKNATLRRLKKGSNVVASTVLGRIGPKQGGKAPHVHFEIRPAGQGAPKIDPKPIIDGWKLLESTAIYRASGHNALYGDGELSIGETMLLPKPLLEKRILSDPRITIYAAGREDIRTGQIDRRVLAVLAYLADSGMNPTVSCLKSGHSLMTSSGNISEHSSGNAVDISEINGVPITGHQQLGGITDQAVRRLMLLQGTMRPHQIISLLDYGQNTLALPDHYNHIHVGFHPLFGDNKKLGREASTVLRPGQWDNLVQRLGEIQNPSVPTKPSRFAIPDKHGHR